MIKLCRPDGPLDAKIAFVGARPGKHEVGLCDCPFGYHRTDVGLVGPSGNLLWGLLKQQGISRKDCYVTNIRQDFSSTHAVPTEAEISEAKPILQDELTCTSANVIVALGREALYALCGKSSIEAWRGSILPSTLLPGRKVIGTWHPAAVLRTPNWAYVLDCDLRKARRECEFPEIKRPQRNFCLNPSFDDALSFLRSLTSPISVDIETLSNISCIGIADSPNRAICIPLVGPINMSLSQLATVLREINKVFQTHEVIGQNFILFDQPKLEAFGFRIPKVKIDTMLAHHLLWPELGMKRKQDDGTEKYAGAHDLAFLTSTYTDEPYYKHLAREWQSDKDWPKYWRYNCLDCVVTYEIAQRLEEELIEFNQLTYYKRNVHDFAYAVYRMQQRGIQIDQSKFASVRARISLECAYLQAELNRVLGYIINVRSVTDLRRLLYDTLSLRQLKLTKKGAAATDEETLLNLAYNSPHEELFRLILKVREKRTLLSSFLQMEVPSDGRYRAIYKVHGTDSGRLASQSPYQTTGAKGPQLQNIPKSARSLFVSRPGHHILQGDLRRAESMFVGYDANDTFLVELFSDESRDLYKEVAARALSINVADVVGWQRELFKRVVHGSNYGMGASRFVKVLRLAGINIEDLPIKGLSAPTKKAEYILELYHQVAKGVRPWQKEIERQIRATRTLYDAFGRRRFIMGSLYDPHTIMVAMSYRPQASITSITNQALQRLDAAGWGIILQVHDSLAIECPTERLAECAQAMQEAFKIPMDLPGGRCTIPLDLQQGPSWGELETYNGIVA